MNHFYNNKEDALRDKLLHHEFAPVPGAWDKMSQLLDEQAPAATQSSRRGWWWWSATALLLTGSILGGAYFLGTPSAATAEPASPASAPALTPAPAANATPIVQDQAAPAAPVPPTQQASPVAQTAATNTAMADVAPAPKRVAATTTTNNAGVKSPTRSYKTVETIPTPAEPSVSAEAAPEATTVESDLDEVSKANKNNLPVLKRRTEIIYQYSTTPLRALQQQRQQLTQPYQGEVGDFGITEEFNKPSRPLEASVYAGGSVQASNQLQSIQMRPVVGVQADYRISKHHGVQLGAQYRSMATHLSQNSGIIDPAYPISNELLAVDAIDIPIAYQLHPHPRYHIKAGVMTSVLLNAQTSESGNMPVQDLSISPVGVSLLVGAEYEINKHWAVALQYNHGLLNLISSEGDVQSYSMDAQSVAAPGGPAIIPTQWRGSDVQLLLKYRF